MLSLASRCKGICKREINWVHFDENLRQLQQIADVEAKDEIERSPQIIKMILSEKKNDIKAAMEYWTAWSKWRQDIHSHASDEISDISSIVDKKLAVWMDSTDKMGRRCCVVTARNHSPHGRVMKTFKRFLVYIIEQGCLYGFTDEKEQLNHISGSVRNFNNSEVCVIYDRRGITSDHTDPDLVMNCQRLVGDLRRWYGARLGVVYILYVGWFLWLLYLIGWPFLYIMRIHNKVIIVKRAEDLLLFFDKYELEKTNIINSCSPVKSVGAEINIEVCDIESRNDDRELLIK